jgi:hypothetical protein
MRKQILMTAAALLMAFCVPAFAQNQGGSRGTGGDSNAHISAQGRANTNGPDAANPAFGRDRAAARHRQHGLAHKTTSKTKHVKSIKHSHSITQVQSGAILTR